jgi:hypothetical protein
MKEQASPVRRRWGFRLSVTDALVLTLAGGLSFVLQAKEFPLWWIAPMVTGNFFLFCNVFLVRQRLELIWAVLLVINVGAHLALGFVNWPSPLLFQLPVTILVIGWQISSPWYHGIMANRINSRLQEYLADKL